MRLKFKKERDKDLETFFDFLHRISKKKKGDDIDTRYRNIKLYLIGKDEVLKKYGVAPYYQRIQEDCRNGVSTLYLLAMQKNYHITAVEVLSKLLSENGIAYVDDKYIGEIKNGLKTAIIRMVAS